METNKRTDGFFNIDFKINIPNNYSLLNIIDGPINYSFL